jgi:catechol 2,3-dioxygenase-like lactoylglutathione lyase family enzyme
MIIGRLNADERRFLDETLYRYRTMYLREEGQVAIDVRGIAPLLEVFDMPTSIHFYRDRLGFEVAATSKAGNDFGWALLRLNGVELMLNTAYDEGERPAVPDPARVAGHADTCIFFGCPDVDAAYRHLRAQGVNVKEPSIRHYGMKQLYVTDPDGFGLCFQWRVTDRE